MKRPISRLHFITTDNISLAGEYSFQIEQALRGGSRWIQLRAKSLDKEDFMIEAIAAKKLSAEYGAVLIINDHADVASEIDSDGVHLGRDDMSIEEARLLFGTDKIIGATANNMAEFQQALDSSADYIGLGPFRFTHTKKKLSPILSTDELSEIIRSGQGQKPVLLIGGITIADIAEVYALGGFGIAVSSLIAESTDPVQQTKNIIQTIENTWTGSL